ncbi:MAG TPA: hypothetical protein VNW68_00280 [Candidatus Limnocylindria bacterium]|nr:hypothetical protein [Candidatus Limnocylindria bacterium]
MSALTIAQALPYVNWMVLAALGVGAFAYVVLAARLTDATRGYLRFTAACAATLGGLALAADLALEPQLALPEGAALAIRAAAPELDALRRAGLAVFALAGLVYVAAAPRRPRVDPLGAISLAAGAGALAAAAVGWAPTAADSVPLMIQLLVLAAAAGGSLATLILGHWYLVTPKLSAGPLASLTRLLLWAIAIQALLFVLWTTLGTGPWQEAWTSLTGPAALFVWLRLLVSLLFAIVLTAMALRTAQMRSMESATGLLYINLAAVLAGTIGAAALYVSAGLLV